MLADDFIHFGPVQMAALVLDEQQLDPRPGFRGKRRRLVPGDISDVERSCVHTPSRQGLEDFLVDRLDQGPEGAEAYLCSLSHMEFRRLYFHHSDLRALPAEVPLRLSGGLQSLSLLGNRLTQLPECISALRVLRHLNLAHNQLENVDAVSGVTSLCSLILNDNQLRYLPDSLQSLQQLQYLSLVRNQLMLIPESLGRLSKLTDLRLNENKLLFLPWNLHHAVTGFTDNALFQPVWRDQDSRGIVLLLALPSHPLEMSHLLRTTQVFPTRTSQTPISYVEATVVVPLAQPQPLLELAASAVLRQLNMLQMRLYSPGQLARARSWLGRRGLPEPLIDELLDGNRRCAGCGWRYLRSEVHVARVLWNCQKRSFPRLLPFYGRLCSASACNQSLQLWNGSAFVPPAAFVDTVSEVRQAQKKWKTWAFNIHQYAH
jgi:hypothetical protein